MDVVEFILIKEGEPMENNLSGTKLNQNALDRTITELNRNLPYLSQSYITRIVEKFKDAPHLEACSETIRDIVLQYRVNTLK
jgi:hypothetical protein